MNEAMLLKARSNRSLALQGLQKRELGIRPRKAPADLTIEFPARAVDAADQAVPFGSANAQIRIAKVQRPADYASLTKEGQKTALVLMSQQAGLARGDQVETGKSPRELAANIFRPQPRFAAVAV